MNIYDQIFLEGYYDAINSVAVDDVFDNFENKYGKDNTTELTTFKDMKQRDGFAATPLERPNLLKLHHKKNQNIGVDSKCFKSINYLKEAEDEYEDEFISDIDGENPNGLENKKSKKIDNHYMKWHNEAFLEGYYDALEDNI